MRFEIDDFDAIKIDGRNISYIEWDGDTVVLMLEQNEEETAKDGWQTVTYYPEGGELIAYETQIINPDGSDGRTEESKLTPEGKELCKEVIKTFIDADIMSWEDGEVEFFPTLSDLLDNAVESLHLLGTGLHSTIKGVTLDGKYKVINVMNPDTVEGDEELKHTVFDRNHKFVYDKDADEVVVYGKDGNISYTLAEAAPFEMLYTALMLVKHTYILKSGKNVVNVNELVNQNSEEDATEVQE